MTSESLRDAILADLKRSGAPLEMRVAARFMSAAHIVPAAPRDLNTGPAFDTVSQGAHYWDNELDAHREIDVVGIAWSEDRAASVTVVAECKHREGGALVVFYGPEGTEFDDYTSPAASDEATLWLAENRQSGTGDQRLVSGVRGHAGYALRFMPGDNKKDHAYSAVQQVVSAAQALLPSVAAEWHVAFPVIVTDVPLFRCQLGHDAEPVLTNAERGWIRWPHPTHRGQFLTIHIVGEEDLDDFLTDAAAASHEMLKRYSAPPDLN